MAKNKNEKNESEKQQVIRPEKWLWLEDEISTVDDISILKPIKVLHAKQFTSIVEFGEQLVEIKNNTKNSLSDYGLILDIMIQGAAYIDLPEEWTGKKYSAVPTNNGYDAGIVFVEKFFLNIFEQSIEEKEELKPFWNPPPPIIFLTIMSSETEETQRRLNDIRRKWAKYNNVSFNEAKVAYIRKFDATNKVFEELFTKWFGRE